MKALFEFHAVRTSDAITLEGVLAEPGRRTKTIVVWVHGLTASFYSRSERLATLASTCNRNGIAFASFNNRGHDIATSFNRGKGKKSLIAGGALERFPDCVKDLAVVIGFLHRKKYQRIYLVGHSTGANKVSYYMARTRDPRVKGVALAGPMSDAAIEKDRLGKSFASHLRQVASYAQSHNQDWPLPERLSKRILSARRYLSLHTPEGAEDIFPYHVHHASWPTLKKVRPPLAVVIGQRDQYLGHWRAEKLIDVFRKNATGARRFRGIVIPRADHSFTKTGKELARVIVRWVRENR